MSFRNLESQLARWLQQIQQYDFEIIRRKGCLYSNAHGWSRRPCEGNNYCCKQESKEGEIIERIIFNSEQINRLETRAVERLDIKKVFFRKKRKSTSKLAGNCFRKQFCKNLLISVGSLVIENNILYRRWETLNLKSHVLQIIVPRETVKQILEEAHDSFSDRHFGVNKTLDRIQKRFYWATCKQDVEDWLELALFI